MDAIFSFLGDAIHIISILHQGSVRRTSICHRFLEPSTPSAFSNQPFLKGELYLTLVLIIPLPRLLCHKSPFTIRENGSNLAGSVTTVLLKRSLNFQTNSLKPRWISSAPYNQSELHPTTQYQLIQREMFADKYPQYLPSDACSLTFDFYWELPSLMPI
jgi:hypothetical protein